MASKTVFRKLPRAVEAALLVSSLASTISLATRAELTSDARQVVARSALPVLVPADSGLARSARIIAEDQFLAVSSRADSVHVSLHANLLELVERLAYVGGQGEAAP